VSFSRPGTIRGKYSTSCGRLVCSYYVRCVSTPEILADVSVNHSRTGAVKLFDKRRDDQSSNSSGYVRRLQLSRRPQLGLRSSPRSKRMTRPCASRTLLSSCLRGQCRLTLWEPWTPGEPTWPARPFRRSQLCTCAGHATAPAISGALSTRPNVDGVAGRIQRSELLPSRDALRPE